MKIMIDIPEELYKRVKTKYIPLPHDFADVMDKAINNGTPLANITDEQISDAFQIAIVNYWESKSKYLTPPPTPCDCPIKKEVE